MNSKIEPSKFEYFELPALRFIGIDAWRTKEDWGDMWRRKQEFLPHLDEMVEQINPIMPHVCALMHHDNGEVDIVNHFIIGRFFKKDTPVPQGYDYRDLEPQTIAYAVFNNMSEDKLWQRYEVTRDKILSEGVSIPYPVGYWHAEVYYDKTPIIEKDDPLFSCGVLFACNKK
jgi:hypothetical protein